MKRVRGLILVGCLFLFGSAALIQTRASMKGAVSNAADVEAAAVPIAPALPGREVMTDRCSAEVAIVPSYDERPDSQGTIILKRAQNGRTDWTPPINVKLGGSGHVRWWCHSTTGNAFDPGTWRIQDIHVGTKCELFADGQLVNCKPDAGIKLGSSAWNGWTPERSRCDDRSKRIRARLGPDRLLQIECMGK